MGIRTAGAFGVLADAGQARQGRQGRNKCQLWPTMGVRHRPMDQDRYLRPMTQQHACTASSKDAVNRSPLR